MAIGKPAKPSPRTATRAVRASSFAARAAPAAVRTMTILGSF